MNDVPHTDPEQLLERTLAEEEQRMSDLEERVEKIRSSQAAPRPGGILPGSILDDADSGSGAFRELSVDERSGEAAGLDDVDDAEVAAARRLLAQSGEQLRAVEEQLARLEANPRDGELRAATPPPRPEAVAPPATRYSQPNGADPSPDPSIDFPEAGYRTQAISPPRHALPTPSRETRVVVPHSTDRYDRAITPPAPGPSGADLERLANGQERMLARLSALEEGLTQLRTRQAAQAAAPRVEVPRVANLERRLDQLETVVREILRATRERSQQTEALGESLSALRRDLQHQRAPAPAAPARPLSESGRQGRELIARIRSGDYRRPDGAPDVSAIRARLVAMSEEHQTLVQAHADLLARMLDLLD